MDRMTAKTIKLQHAGEMSKDEALAFINTQLEFDEDPITDLMMVPDEQNTNTVFVARHDKDFIFLEQNGFELLLMVM